MALKCLLSQRYVQRCDICGSPLGSTLVVMNQNKRLSLPCQRCQIQFHEEKNHTTEFLITSSANNTLDHNSSFYFMEPQNLFWGHMHDFVQLFLAKFFGNTNKQLRNRSCFIILQCILINYEKMRSITVLWSILIQYEAAICQFHRFSTEIYSAAQYRSMYNVHSVLA